MATYYISNTGNDANDGLSESTSWQTVAKVNAFNFSAGDIIKFKRGDTWNEELVLGQYKSNLVVTDYGNANLAKPKLYGWKNLTGWTNDGGGIYSITDATLPSYIRFLELNGKFRHKGRFPKTWWYDTDSITGTTSGNLVSSAITGLSSFVGAEMVVSKSDWVIDRVNVLTQAGDTVTWDGGSSSPAIGVQGFFFQNHINCLTELGDWMYDPTTNKISMYFGSEDPANYLIRVSVLDRLLFVDYYNEVDISNLVLEGANNIALETTGWQITSLKIHDCEIYKCGVEGIKHNGDESGVGVYNNIIEDCLDTGIRTDSIDDSYILNNEIRRIGLYQGHLVNGDSTTMGIAHNVNFGSNNNNWIAFNTIEDIGYHGIRFFGTGYTIENNTIRRYNQSKIDGGGIYTFGEGTGGIDTNRIIRANIISNENYVIPINTQQPVPLEAGYGIYADNNAQNIQILNNTLIDNYAGIYLHENANIEVRGNNIYKSREAGIHVLDDAGDLVMNNIIFEENKIVINKGGRGVRVWNQDGSDFGTIFSSFDNNYYIAEDNDFVMAVRHLMEATTEITYDQWKTTYGLDNRSKTNPNDSVNFSIIYNPNENEEYIHFGINKVDVDGNVVDSPKLFKSFESLIVLNDGIMEFPENPIEGQRYPETKGKLRDHYMFSNGAWQYIMVNEAPVEALDLLSEKPVKSKTLKQSFDTIDQSKFEPDYANCGEASDWYLPNKGEAGAMYTELHLQGVGNFNTADRYWVSNESTTNGGFAWGFTYTDGTSTGIIKTSAESVRPIRDFISNKVYALRDEINGGLVFHIEDLLDGTFKYYIAALEDSPITLPFGTNGTVVGVTDESIGAGKANTALFIAAIEAATETGTAAQYCDDLIAGISTVDVYSPKNGTPINTEKLLGVDIINGSETKVLSEKGSFVELDNSKWEATTEIAEKTGYGALYNWYAVDESAANGGFITGFHVPTDAEWTVLTDHLGGLSVAGDKLKSTRTDPDIAPRWNSPNTGVNSVNFNTLGSGSRHIDGTFNNIGIIGSWWSSTEYDINTAWGIAWYHSINIIDTGNDQKESGNSIRCVRTAALTAAEQLLSDGTFLTPVQDYDGNWYEVVKIGSQAWLAQNLRTTHFADGTPIPNVTDNTTWGNLTTGAYCWYNNNISTAGVIFTDEEIEHILGLKPKDSILKVDSEYIDQRIKFYSTTLTGNFTILADMLYTEVKIDSLTNIDVTLANIDVGEFLSFDVISTGYPNFLASATQRINKLALNTALLVEEPIIMITRKEDDGGNEVYEILGGKLYE